MRELSRRDEYAQQTRQALLASALTCFSTLGYTATSLDEVCQRARVTRGALYHHFSGKRQLFEEIFEQLERTNVELLATATSGTDPMERATSGLTAFLDLCAQDPFRSIVLREGPMALGWTRWRELDQRHTLTALEDQLEALSASGVIAGDVGPVMVQLLYSALHEAARMVAEAASPQDAAAVRAESVETLMRMLAGLSLPPAHRAPGLR